MANQRYAFVWSYRSGHGEWVAGQEHEFDPETAAHILRDSPGCIVPVVDGDGADESRAVKAPPKDRMQRPRNDRGAGEPITKADFKAVRD